ncbi:MAG: ketopantoate reductase family protein [Candidatus Methanofastidiosia archaeon]
MRFLIVGGGAVGGIVGASLEKGGESVVIYDRNCEHVKAINKRGLLISDIGREERVRLKATCHLEELKGKFDVILLCVRAYSTFETMKKVRPHLEDDGMVVSLQNGMGNEELIASVVGEERTVGGVVGFSATKISAGHITMTSSTSKLVIGRLDGKLTKSLRKLGDVLNKGIPTEVSSNIKGHLFTKLLINSGVSSLQGLTGLAFKDLIKEKEAKPIFFRIITEGLRIAKALKIKPKKLYSKIDLHIFEVKESSQSLLEREYRKLRDFLYFQLIKLFARKFSRMRSSMILELENKRRTEIKFLNGYLVSQGKRLGVSTPINERVFRLIREIENGEREMGIQNLEEF